MNRKIRLFIQWFIAILFWICTSVFASGVGQGDAISQVESGTLLLRFDNELSQADEIQSNDMRARGNFTGSSQWVAPRLESQVDIKVTGPIVRVVLSQTFTNPAQYWAEGIYVFPLPENAAVDHMRMQIGERIIEGQIKERAAAKKVYQQAKQSGHRASLVEQERSNIFTTSVANIPPGMSITVIIEYQHEAKRVHDKKGEQYSLRFPMTITPRYTPGTRFPHSAQAADIQTDTQRISPPWGLSHENHNPTEVNVSVEPGFDIVQLESRYHQINKSQIAPRHWRASLPADQHHANADFVLEWSGRELDTPQLQWFTEHHKGSEYGLLMISPPLARGDVQVMPRDITYVIDTSGSMGGESIRQAKKALMWAVGRLGSHDRFNIIEFNSGAWGLFDSAQVADQSNIAAALGFIKGLKAQGGTEMKRALDLALCVSCQSPERLRQVIFLTDGAVGNEQQLFASINNTLGQTRLFTVGIGSAPNSYFMRRAAEIGRGTFTYIGKLDEVNEKMQALFASIEAPVLTNLHLELPDDDQRANHEVTPSPIPDLYAGSTLVLAIKSKYLPKQLSLVGSLNGRPWQTDLEVPKQGLSSSSETKTQSGIHVLWARKQIASLLTERSLTRDMKVKDELKRDVLKLALQHHLISPFTSLVAVDTTLVKPQTQKTLSHQLKTNAPKGTTFGLPKTATPAQLYSWLGLLCLILAALMGIILQRKSLSCAPIHV